MANTGPKVTLVARYFLGHAKSWLYNKTTRGIQAVWSNATVSRVNKAYEDWIGITEIKSTQALVIKLESEFVGASKQRRDVHSQLLDLQNQLKELRLKLDGTHRGDERYLTLVTQEHQLIKSEMQLTSQLRSSEEVERDLFSRFSNKLRDSHEVERQRQEKTKYISYVLSLAGVILGILASSVNHYLHDRDINRLVGLVRESQVLSSTASQQQQRHVTSESKSVDSRNIQPIDAQQQQNAKDLKQSQTSSSSANLTPSGSMNLPLDSKANTESDNQLSSKPAQESLSKTTQSHNSSSSTQTSTSVHQSQVVVPTHVRQIIDPINASIAVSQSNLEQKIKLVAIGQVAATYALAVILIALFVSRD